MRERAKSEPPADPPTATESPSAGVASSSAGLEWDALVVDSPEPEPPPRRTSLCELVPTAFQWFGPCQMVFLAGSFNEWKERIPLHRCASGRDWAVVLNLPPGDYTYKYVVQNGIDEGLCWEHAPDQAAGRDAMGNINNFITVVDQHAYEVAPGYDDDDGYAQHVPEELVEIFFAPEPPALPSFLEPLAGTREEVRERGAAPTHSTLQHLCVCEGARGSEATSHGESRASSSAGSSLPPAVTLSVKQRHRGKFVEMVLVKPGA